PHNHPPPLHDALPIFRRRTGGANTPSPTEAAIESDPASCIASHGTSLSTETTVATMHITRVLSTRNEPRITRERGSKYLSTSSTYAATWRVTRKHARATAPADRATIPESNIFAAASPKACAMSVSNIPASLIALRSMRPMNHPGNNPAIAESKEIIEVSIHTKARI